MDGDYTRPVTDSFIIVGDRVLIRPKTPEGVTPSGLVLPPGVQENQKTQLGYVLKAGPGYPIPIATDADEPWKEQSDTVKYIPLQAKPGDLAMYLQSGAYDIEYNGEKFAIVPQNAILLLVREEY
ncbi:MAG: co-chaperone GroES [Candidatus Kapabacteria bacterium]|nr:co-chaperone GroES [Candidatus Kapabacteria bacterium]